MEFLESRELLSALPITMSETRHAVSLPIGTAAKTPRAGSFQLVTKGTITRLTTPPDNGSQYHFSTAGQLAGLGRVNVSGQITTPGFTMSSPVTGTATIQTRRGLLFADLGSSPIPGFSNVPSAQEFRITGGTGIFAHHHTGQGTIQVTILPSGTQYPGETKSPVRMVFNGRLS